MVEAVTGGDVEPRVARLAQRVEPPLARRTARFERGQDVGGDAPLGEQVVDAEFDREHGEPLELVIGPVHDHVDARHHPGHGLVADLGERLLAELEEDHVGAVAEHQHLGVVVPHLRVQREHPVEVLLQVVVLRDADRAEDDLGPLPLGQRRNRDRLDLGDQGAQPVLPSLVEGVPVLEVVPGPRAEFGRAALDLGRVEDRVGGDVDPAVDDPVLDAERGREDEQPRGVGADRLVRHLPGDGVEGRHRLGEVHGVVEPEALVVVGLEAREVPVHGAPVLRAGHVGDLRGEREACLFRHWNPLSLVTNCNPSGFARSR